MIDKEALLQVKDFSISFRMYEKGIKQSNVKAVSNLSLDLYKGEVLAIVGSSGSGKSLLAHGIMGLLPDNAITSGCIVYEGEELTEDRLRKLRGAKIALVPQSISYLDPLIKIGKQVQGTNRSKAAQKRQKESFDRYDLCEKSAQLYPFQLSGGMARRGLIATADQKDVDLIIADEPTPGLENVNRIYDIGVAGIHRLLSKVDEINKSNCIIAVAGMEGALPGVIAGMVDKPVIAVPTSIGYGSNFGGLSALLTMLNSCAEGISVVNIDNGFGAGYMATQINRLVVNGNE